MYYVYILRSKKLERNYIGFTSNLKLRYEEHCAGLSKYTSRSKDWKIIYVEVYSNYDDAIIREKRLKYFGKAYTGLKKRLKYTFIDFEGGIQDSQKTTGLIGSRCKPCKGFSQGDTNKS